MSNRNLAIKRDGSLVVIRGYKAAGIARSAGLRPTYSGAAGGWMLDASRLPELVAWLEYRNYRYTLEGDAAVGDAHRHVHRAQVGVADAELVEQESLW